MNGTRKHRPIRAMSLPVALLLSLIAYAPLSAQETGPVYTMTVIIDAAHGAKVAAGRYERAIDKINSSNSKRDPYSKQTNLCVAYTKTGELDKATEACNAALAIVRDNNAPRPSYPGFAQANKADRVYLALALSNLGVLHAAKGHPDSARKSFRQALELGTGLSAPKTNLARLAKSDAPSA